MHPVTRQLDHGRSIVLLIPPLACINPPALYTSSEAMYPVTRQLDHGRSTVLLIPPLACINPPALYTSSEAMHPVTQQVVQGERSVLVSPLPLCSVASIYPFESHAPSHTVSSSGSEVSPPLSYLPLRSIAKVNMVLNVHRNHKAY